MGHIAVACCNPSAVQMLLKHDRYASSVGIAANSGKTPLHIAASKTLPALIETLLQDPAVDHLPLDDDGNTPVHWAAWHGNITAMKTLFADDRIREMIDAPNNEGKTAFAIAAERGHDDLVAFLRSADSASDDAAAAPYAFVTGED